MLGVRAGVIAVLSCLLSLGLVVTPTSASPDQGLVVLFIEGLNSDSSDEGGTFVHLWNAVHLLQPAAERTVFSYRGGSVNDDGVWQPDPYTACDTQQSLTVSLPVLTDTIQTLRSRWPDAKLVVVGHSLGGFLAMSWLATAAEAATSTDELPDAVVAVDSPLRGLAPEQVAFAWNQGLPAGCVTPAAQLELVQYRRDGEDRLSAGLARAADQQRRVVIIGNEQDIAFSCCGGPNIVNTQFLDVPGVSVIRFPALTADMPPVPPGRLSSHHAALFNGAVVQFMATLLVTL